ncbi:DUF2158 domain-containing protein [Bradyrhizobium sp. JYMT SZCCT0428]|uniref:DUF2158 domain-containing protein n=1 Tax=Bradyrhizobium sp. JYMT SZCCT0428 TaxID=2807673 RepID=UPI001BAC7D07|nr:DUF2158 domain-containing protein [Bradyrhizobium sp. JYMT SZCCT0428]MBR1156814.1 DUF2158 domain-containing protein [Bradyrhizobium sp. JYMT SZCCT0428]
MNFDKGDRVKLKSGSPMMTVSEVHGGLVWCVWFSKTTKYEDSFEPQVLEKAGLPTMSSTSEANCE